MKFKKFLAAFIFLPLIKSINAHCPLCTAGAAAAAGGAAWLGISEAIIGIFVGAFAVSVGWWVSRIIKKQYIPFQRSLIILVSYLTTILPLLAVVGGNHPVYISLTGDYGSLLNRTYLVNLFFIGSIMGSFIVSITPWLSSKITEFRNGNMVPFQGASLTLALLIIVSIAVEVII